MKKVKSRHDGHADGHDDEVPLAIGGSASWGETDWQPGHRSAAGASEQGGRQRARIENSEQDGRVGGRRTSESRIQASQTRIFFPLPFSPSGGSRNFCRKMKKEERIRRRESTMSPATADHFALPLNLISKPETRYSFRYVASAMESLIVLCRWVASKRFSTSYRE